MLSVKGPLIEFLRTQCQQVHLRSLLKPTEPHRGPPGEPTSQKHRCQAPHEGQGAAGQRPRVQVRDFLWRSRRTLSVPFVCAIMCVCVKACVCEVSELVGGCLLV